MAENIDELIEFLRSIGISEEQIEVFIIEKIDAQTVINIDDITLAKYIPLLGDRVALRKCCAAVPINKSAKKSKRTALFEILKQKFSSPEEMPRTSPSKTETEKKRNVSVPKKRQRKTTRFVEMGWIHNKVQVRRRQGGGTRKFEIDREADQDVLQNKALSLFFPKGMSPKGKQEDFTFSLLDFKDTPVPSGASVNDFYEELNVGIMSFYLHSTNKEESIKNANDADDSEIYFELPKSSTATDDPLTSCDVGTTLHILVSESVTNEIEMGGSTSTDLITIDEVQSVATSAEDTRHCLASSSEPSLRTINDLPEMSELVKGDKIVTIHRVRALHEMIAAFKDPMITHMPIKFEFIDEKGQDSSGVSRDAYTAFWTEFFIRLADGENACVPALCPEMGKEEWASVGRILVKGFIDQAVFPMKLSQAFAIALILGEEAISPNILLDNLKLYLSQTEMKVVIGALDGKMTEEDAEDFLDILDRFSCHTKVTNANVLSTMHQIAHKQLIQEPSYALKAMASVGRDILQLHFPDIASIEELYTQKELSARKIINLFDYQPQNSDESKSLNFFYQYVKSQNNDGLRKLMRFLTGSDMLSVNHINLTFSQLIGFERRPIARTCGPILELPSTYDNYRELRCEFDNILNGDLARECLEMNIS